MFKKYKYNYIIELDFKEWGRCSFFFVIVNKHHGWKPVSQYMPIYPTLSVARTQDSLLKMLTSTNLAHRDFIKKKKATSCLKIAGHCGFSERDSNRKYTTFCQGFSGSETNTDPNIEIQTEVWESVLTRVFVAVYLWPTMQSGTQQSVGMKSELALSWHLCKLGWMSARKNECHVQTGLTRFVFCQCAFDMQDIYTYVWPS